VKRDNKASLTQAASVVPLWLGKVVSLFSQQAMLTCPELKHALRSPELSEDECVMEKPFA
jgi:hypothetical protein